jgi:hypothetical protein
VSRVARSRVAGLALFAGTAALLVWLAATGRGGLVASIGVVAGGILLVDSLRKASDGDWETRHRFTTAAGAALFLVGVGTWTVHGATWNLYALRWSAVVAGELVGGKQLVERDPETPASPPPAALDARAEHRMGNPYF